MSDPTRLADRLEQQLDGLPKWCGQPFPVHPNAAHGGVYNYCPTCCLHQKSHTIAEAAAALRQTPAPAREMPINILDALHDILGRFGILSRSHRDEYAGLPEALINWAATACRQSRVEHPHGCPECAADVFHGIRHGALHTQHQVKALTAERDALKAQLSEEEAKHYATNLHLKGMQESVDGCAQRVQQIASERDALRADLADARELLRAKERAIDAYRERNVALTAERDALRAVMSELDALRARCEALEAARRAVPESVTIHERDYPTAAWHAYEVMVGYSYRSMEEAQDLHRRVLAALRDPGPTPAQEGEQWTLRCEYPHGKGVVVLTPAQVEAVRRILDGPTPDDTLRDQLARLAEGELKDAAKGDR